MRPASRAASAADSRCSRSQHVYRRGTSRRPGVPKLRDAEREQRLLELLPQVRYIARRVHDRLPSHVPFEDSLQAGVLGLMDAFRRFDPRKKVQLESYMKFRIRGAILDELRSLDWSPRELRRKARQMEEAEQRLRARLGRNPAVSELAGEMHLSLVRFHRLLGEIRGLELSSLQEVAVTSEDGAVQDYASQVAAPEASSPLHLCANEEERAKLTAALHLLPQRERLVLTLYYYEELTMKEIGEVISVGESRVSQIHSLALLRLRGYLAQQVKEGTVEPCPVVSAQPPRAFSVPSPVPRHV
jgi:RNA polymerase sigma factor for flagellar operon FliA